MTFTNQLVGTWRIIAFDDRKDEQSPWQSPFGEHPIGYLVYDPTGHMSFQIMKTPPPAQFTAEGGWGASPEEAKLVFDGYAAYFGRYSVDEVNKVVTHHVEGSLWPNYIGTDQERPISLEGDRLTFSNGKTWRRIFERVR